MLEQKPIRTFKVCDEKGNKYEVNEFKLIAEAKLDGVKAYLLTPSIFKTTDNTDVKFENETYYLLTKNVEKIKLINC